MPLHSIHSLSFNRTLRFIWDTGNPPVFQMSIINDELVHQKNVIYIWYNAAQESFLNVGQTGSTIKTRFKDYERWLNGLRKGDIETPIRHRWLEALSNIPDRSVEVWTKASSDNKKQREIEEEEWIEKLKPLLNIRRIKISS